MRSGLYKLLSPTSLSPKAALKNTLNTLAGFRLSCGYRKSKKPDKELLKNLYQSGFSLPQLGQPFGAHRSTVSNWMRYYGIERRSFKPWTEEEISTLKKFYPTLKKVKMILPLLPARTLESIYKKAQELGIRWISKKKPSREKLEELYSTLGTKRAADYLGISPTHFRRWMKGAGARLKSPVKNPDLNPSAKLMYILGVLKGDGYVYKRGKRAHVVELSAISEKFVRSFANALTEIDLAPSVRTRYISGYANYRVYVVSAISKNFVEWYRNLDLTQIKEMIGENKELATAFIRGFYESEGSCEISKGYPYISMCNTDLPVLLLVKDLASSLGYDLNLNKAGSTSTGKPFYRLRKCGKSVPRFIDVIKPSIITEPKIAESTSVTEGGT